ncbi:hypothetical protein [Nocardia asiatica]|uniref:hypothetical protein n=1 Tax=Nocardia asiatica TaxID=209252 RepID=UPI000300A936|nr:hypothetical protein [Nocardia asiatica]
MNSTAFTDLGKYFLTDNDKAYLRIDFGRDDDTGVVTVDLTTPALARDEPVRVTLNGALVAERNLPAARKPCDCPESSESVVGGVHVRHHQGCLHGEPRQYMWQYEGQLYTGNLADYARHWENLDPEAQQALTRTGDELRTWAPADSYPLSITGDMDNDYWFHYRLSTGDEWIIVAIDGRAEEEGRSPDHAPADPDNPISHNPAFAAPPELRGCLIDGRRTAEQVNSVLGRLSELSGLRLVCVWEFVDTYGFAGHSNFYIATNGEALRHLSGDLGDWLTLPTDDPDSPQTPGDPASWIDAVTCEFTTTVLVGDGLHNYATEDRR